MRRLRRGKNPSDERLRGLHREDPARLYYEKVRRGIRPHPYEKHAALVQVLSNEFSIDQKGNNTYFPNGGHPPEVWPEGPEGGPPDPSTDYLYGRSLTWITDGGEGRAVVNALIPKGDSPSVWPARVMWATNNKASANLADHIQETLRQIMHRDEPIPLLIYYPAEDRAWRIEWNMPLAMENPGGDESMRRAARAAQGGDLEAEVAHYQNLMRRGLLFPELLALMSSLYDPAARVMVPQGVGYQVHGQEVFGGMDMLFDTLEDGVAQVDVPRRAAPISAFGPVCGVLIALAWVDYWIETFGPGGKHSKSKLWWRSSARTTSWDHVQAFSKFMLTVAVNQFLVQPRRNMGVSDPHARWHNMATFDPGIPPGYYDVWPSGGYPWQWPGDFLDDASSVIQFAMHYGDDLPHGGAIPVDYSYFLHRMATSLLGYVGEGEDAQQITGSPYLSPEEVGHAALRLVKPWATSGSPRHFDPRPYLRGIKP
jgi:hypothetical protein